MSGPGEVPSLAPEEVRAGLLLFPPESPGPGFAADLAAVLATRAVVAFVAAGGGGEWRAAREACRAAGVAFLAAGDGPADADGAFLDDPAGVAAARGRLGAGAIVGAACGASRHAAMVAGEEGADYVVFGPAPPDALAELCEWWAGVSVLPCAADLRGAAGPDAESPVAAGADFLAVREAVWDHPDGPAAAAAGLLRRMEAARAQR